MQQVLKSSNTINQLFETVNFTFIKMFDSLVNITILGYFSFFCKIMLDSPDWVLDPKFVLSKLPAISVQQSAFASKPFVVSQLLYPHDRPLKQSSSLSQSPSPIPHLLSEEQQVNPFSALHLSQPLPVKITLDVFFN